MAPAVSVPADHDGLTEPTGPGSVGSVRSRPRLDPPGIARTYIRRDQ